MNGAAGGEIVLYDAGNGETGLEVRLERDTVWLTQDQMAFLFGRDRSVITKRLGNIFRANELSREATRAGFEQVHTEPGRAATRRVDHYNLDAIILLGYRVNPKSGVRFRIWAMNALRESWRLGSVSNRRRLANPGQAPSDVVSGLIARYADTWRLLVQYDEEEIPTLAGPRPASRALDLAIATAAISALLQELTARGQASSRFGRERAPDALASILGHIERTAFGERPLWSADEPAAQLLYCVIKDHPFTDGNKRIASLLFLLYLAQEKVAHELNPKALTALTLLVAESEPSSKDLMIRLVMNLLAEPGG